MDFRLSALKNDIGRTVDYHAAVQRIASLAGSRHRHLIETLASEIAEMLSREFPARRAEVEVRKFILPQTRYVAVRCVCGRKELNSGAVLIGKVVSG